VPISIAIYDYMHDGCRANRLYLFSSQCEVESFRLQL